jgi:hypothetical protein
VRDWWETTRAMGARASAASGADDPELLEQLAEAAAPWTAADGSLAIPARTWVASAEG